MPYRGCTVGAKAWEGTCLNTSRNPRFQTSSGWHIFPLVHVLRCFTIDKPQDRDTNCHGESSHHPRRVLLRRETLHFEQKLAPRQKKLDKHPYFTACNHTHKSWNSHKCVVPDRDGSNLQRVREVFPRRVGRGSRAQNTPTHQMQNPQTSSAFPPSCLRTLEPATTETTENHASTNCSVAHSTAKRHGSCPSLRVACWVFQSTSHMRFRTISGAVHSLTTCSMFWPTSKREPPGARPISNILY